MADLAIRVENLSKRYRIGLKEEISDTLVGAMTSFLRNPVRNFRRLQRLSHFDNEQDPDILWALKDINFEVQRGEVMGIIGRNGAGKSTLLKILSRITYPTSGRVELHGRVSSLLEVGTGFHPELTGRENVYLNGTILGMTKPEIDRKFDEIVDFSGVEKFIDTPVKRYSSGMRVRLAFSVAAHLEPEILMVDEVLAVGDAEFQKKSLGKMGDVARAGRTVLFVSHNMAAVENLTQWAVYLKDGIVSEIGPTSDVVRHYLQQFNLDQDDVIVDLTRMGGIEISRPSILKTLSLYQAGQPTTMISMGDDIEFRITYDAPAIFLRPQVGIVIQNERGEKVVSFNSKIMNSPLNSIVGRGTLVCMIRGLPLNQGIYTVRLSLSSNEVKGLEIYEQAYKFTVQPRDLLNTGRLPHPSWGIVVWPAEWMHAKVSCVIEGEQECG
ncbi:MAG: ABC transporter ATP-binding protein [Anaerolineales bacterium]|nr:ABC transporter ATP-binding protein [Anaerolineales bacterium]